MNINVTFHISISTFQSGKRYRMLVQHFYSSPQVERFRINGKDERYIIFEKRLALHKQPWRITEGAVDTTNIKEAAMAIRDMQDAIDIFLKNRKNDPQSEGHFLPERPKNKYSR